MNSVKSRKTGTIEDFGEQWQKYDQQHGYYASETVLRDYLGPLCDLESLKGKTACDVGSGNGRIARIMAQYASKVIALEPSDAMKVNKNFNHDVSNIEFIQESIYDFNPSEKYDFAFCLGVLHHLPDPAAALLRIKNSLKDSGRFVLWVYGKEGNELYLLMTNALRAVTVRLPHAFLKALSEFLVYPLKAYIWCCRKLPLPMAKYMTEVLGKYDSYALSLTIYDQLNPSIANYWTKAEVETLLKNAGFKNIVLYHRHGYSWTAVSDA